MKQPRIHISWYITADIIGSLFTWWLFYYLRTIIYHYPLTVPAGFYLGAFLYTVGWLSLHLLSGAYEGIYQKTKITEFIRTLLVTLIGSLVLLFFFILKNPQENNIYYYKEFFCLLVPVFFVTLFIRFVLLNIALKQLAAKKVSFNALLIGTGKTAGKFWRSFDETNKNSGYVITSFLNTNGNKDLQLPGEIRRYNNLPELKSIIRNDTIEEVIITVEKNERELLVKILQQLSDTDVNIKITPDAVDIISGAVQTSDVMGIPLIDVHSGLLPSWQKNLKRFVDLFISILAAVLLSPLLIYTAVRTALSSKGRILFRQERIGYKGKPFIIYKFRSMVEDAEKNGPMLSSEEDERITKWGRVMRKWRLDELPQLWNIMKGEMSLVGPRPERKFYVDQIVEQHSEYKYLFKVKPGLTSWGMVKFGYASSVEEMIQRMPFDLMYVENVSLLLDLRIMILTMATILKGKGK
ncbi:MAG TPA: sugar transferase [Ferruginibacter sp.]|nr:sugar transferase [Ferruginibacter sp.]HPH91590.1 sugar transferase [Ferruginibacter sp.]